MTDTRSAHEREYSPSSCIPSIDVELDRYATASRAAAELPNRRVSSTVTGEVTEDLGEGAGFIVFEGPAGAPLHVFVHGGYWQALSAADSLAAAPEFVAAGWSYAAVDYTLAPIATIGDQIEQCVRAVRRVVDELRPAALVLSGSSAGAHLATHVAHRAATTATGFTVDRLVLLSGIYDLRPLVNTYVNDALGLDDTSAAAWSAPLTPRPASEVLVVHGEFETAAFKAQSARVAAAWDVPVVEVIGRNHFDLVHDLASIDLRLGLPGANAAGARGSDTPDGSEGSDSSNSSNSSNSSDAVVASLLARAERPGAPRRLDRSVMHPIAP